MNLERSILAIKTSHQIVSVLLPLWVVLIGSAAAQQISFNTTKTVPIGVQVTDIASGDFDGDGKLDLIAATGTSLLLIRGLGGGDFTEPVSIPLGSYPNTIPVAVTAADLNGDGRLDLVVGNYGAVSVLLGGGNGTFGAPVSYTIDSGYVTSAIADLNGDGKLDLVIKGNDRSAPQRFLLPAHSKTAKSGCAIGRRQRDVWCRSVCGILLYRQFVDHLRAR